LLVRLMVGHTDCWPCAMFVLPFWMRVLVSIVPCIAV
jgi:hypothetical protein